MSNNPMNYFSQGNYAAIQQENHYTDIAPIMGEIPKELNGVLYRNGPNPQFPDNNKHWFEGDGMLHMFSICNGKMSYRNHWVETERFKLERLAGKILVKGFSDAIPQDPNLIIPRNTANTNIIQHAGKLLALVESSCSTEINPIDLSTIGEWNYKGQIQNMSAHPHFHAITQQDKPHVRQTKELVNSRAKNLFRRQSKAITNNFDFRIK